MISKIQKIRERPFEPFNLVITIESEEDAYRLWHLFNMSSTTEMEDIMISKSNKHAKIPYSNHPGLSQVWNEINERLQTMNN